MLAGKKRILVIGSGGAGKSTVARALAQWTGLPVLHLDRHCSESHVEILTITRREHTQAILQEATPR